MNRKENTHSTEVPFQLDKQLSFFFSGQPRLPEPAGGPDERGRDPGRQRPRRLRAQPQAGAGRHRRRRGLLQDGHSEVGRERTRTYFF